MAAILSALGVSALFLLAFGDMLGLSAPLVRLLALVILGVPFIGIVLTGATARFSRFLDGDHGPHMPRAGLVAALLAGGTALALILTPGLSASVVSLGFLAGFAVALPLFAPAQPDAEMGYRDILIFRAFGTGLLAILVLIAGFPAMLAQIIPLTGAQNLTLGLLLVGIPVILGGMASLAVMASFILLLALLFVLAPLIVELSLSLRGAHVILGGAHVITLAGFPPALPSIPAGAARFALLEPVALGLVLALASRQGRGGTRQKGWLSRPLLGLVLGIGLLASGAAIWAGIEHILASELATRPLSSWPLWAFDEAIRGWITLCGQPIASHQETLRVCAQQGITFSGPLMPDRAMILPSLAIARGWPVLFGILPNFIALLALALVTAMLLQAAVVALGSLWSQLRRRQMALRSQRLALMRCLALLILSLLAVAAISSPAQALLPEGIRKVLLIGTIIFLLMVESAAGIRRWQYWRRQRAGQPAQPMAMASPQPPSLPLNAA